MARLLFAHECTMLTCELIFAKQIFDGNIVSKTMAYVSSARNAELSSQLSEDETEDET